MKKFFAVMLVAVFACFGTLATGCDTCDEDAAAECGVTLLTCNMGCLADEGCQEKCVSTYCSCIDDSGCGDTDEQCK